MTSSGDKRIRTLDFDSLRPPSPFMTEAHEQWRRSLRAFVQKEIEPHIDEWERAGRLPKSLFKAASEFGLLRMGYPEEYGGISEGLDIFHSLVTSEELNRPGAGGVNASLMVHGIGLPPIVALGSEDMKRRV
ncbi:MAG: acyl-CoA dehydrogenase family protein, partial [Alphaproteobacteria bacterium]